MAVARVQIETHHRQTDPPRDYTDNTLYFVSGTDPSGDSDWEELATKVAAVWHNNATEPSWGWMALRGSVIRVYDMLTPPPRPVKVQVNTTPGTWSAAPLNPRQIALVLSYYATDLNQPRTRGRIYVGPIESSAGSGEKPLTNVMGAVIDLGRQLHSLAGTTAATWQHAVYSEANSVATAVKHYWVNDVWDTQRRRLQKETTRQKLDF